MSTVQLFRQFLAGLRTLVLLTLVVGVVYPLVVMGIGQVGFRWRADGSLVTATGAHTTTPSAAAGSLLLGQGFTGRTWFHSRPSDAGDGWDTLASGGSDLGPDSSVLVREIEQRRAAVAAREGVDPSLVPPDAVTASASGLDPDISPAYAALQAPRVARANGLALTVVRRLVADHTAGRTWGVLGDPHVNVLALNLAVQGAARRAVPDAPH